MEVHNERHFFSYQYVSMYVHTSMGELEAKKERKMSIESAKNRE